MKRLLLGFAALVLVVVAFAETAAARNPGGRNFNGAVFSAGVSGDATTAPGPAIGSAPGPLDALVRVSTDQGVSGPLTAEELTTSGRPSWSVVWARGSMPRQ